VVCAYVKETNNFIRVSFDSLHFKRLIQLTIFTSVHVFYSVVSYVFIRRLIFESPGFKSRLRNRLSCRVFCELTQAVQSSLLGGISILVAYREGHR
jgi:hypothetical protein